MAGLGVAAREARRPSLGEQVVVVVGEERPDRPVYMAGDPRTPFTPPLPRRGDAECRWGQRIASECAPSVRSRARRMEAAKGKTRGFKKWTVILACGLYRILEPKHLPRYTCARARVRTHTHARPVTPRTD